MEIKKNSQPILYSVYLKQYSRSCTFCSSGTLSLYTSARAYRTLVLFFIVWKRRRRGRRDTHAVENDKCVLLQTKIEPSFVKTLLSRHAHTHHAFVISYARADMHTYADLTTRRQRNLEPNFRSSVDSSSMMYFPPCRFAIHCFDLCSIKSLCTVIRTDHNEGCARLQPRHAEPLLDASASP